MAGPRGIKPFILLLAVLIAASSCTVQKRRYQQGFYITKSHRQHLKNTAHHRSQPAVIPAEGHPVSASAAKGLQSSLAAEAGLASPLISFQPARAVLQNDSCDLIIMSSGEEIRVKVSEITPAEVKYRKCSMPDGPVFVTRKSEIFMIRYANGSKEVFEQQVPAKTPAPGPVTYQNQSRQPVDHPNAVLTLILGITGFIPGIGSIPAIIIGNKALREIDSNPGIYKGRGMVLAGVVLGWIKMALLFLYIAIIVAFLLSW